VAYDLAHGIDWQSLTKASQDPSSQLIQNMAAAYNRKQDERIITQALGNRRTGVLSPSTSTALPSGQKFAAAGGTMAFVDLSEMAQKFLEADADLDQENVTVVIRPADLKSLIDSTAYDGDEIKEARDIRSNGIGRLFGMNIVVSNRLNTLGLNPFGFTQGAVCLGEWTGFDVRVDERPDLSYAKQLYCKAEFDAARTEDERVFEITGL
jgi:hypothetical protein